MDRDELMVRLGNIESDTKSILSNQEKQEQAHAALAGRVASLEKSKAKALGWAAAVSAGIGGVVAWFTGGK